MKAKKETKRKKKVEEVVPVTVAEEVTITDTVGSSQLVAFISGDAQMEYLGSIKELSDRITKIEKMLEQVFYPMRSVK